MDMSLKHVTFENIAAKGAKVRQEYHIILPQRSDSQSERLQDILEHLQVAMSLILFRKQSSSLVRIESICRRQINVTQTIESVFHRVENNVGKGENAGYQHFLLFPHCFQKRFCFSGL